MECEFGFIWIRQPGVFACRKGAITPKKNNHVSLSKQLLSDNRRLLSDNRRNDKTSVKQSVRTGKASQLSSSRKKKPSLLFDHEPSQELSSASDTGPSDTKNMLEYAHRLADQGELNKARELCETFINDNSFHIEAHFLMGLICQALDDEERAEVSFNKTVYLDPNHQEALNHLAFIMEHRGDRVRAAQIRRRARRIQSRQREQ